MSKISYPVFDNVPKKMMCIYVPVEFYKAAQDVCKCKGHRNIQSYMVWLLCQDLLHEINDWSKYSENEDDDNM